MNTEIQLVHFVWFDFDRNAWLRALLSTHRNLSPTCTHFNPVHEINLPAGRRLPFTTATAAPGEKRKNRQIYHVLVRNKSTYIRMCALPRNECFLGVRDIPGTLDAWTSSQRDAQ